MSPSCRLMEPSTIVFIFRTGKETRPDCPADFRSTVRRPSRPRAFHVRLQKGRLSRVKLVSPGEDGIARIRRPLLTERTRSGEHRPRIWPSLEICLHGLEWRRRSRTAIDETDERISAVENFGVLPHLPEEHRVPGEGRLASRGTALYIVP